MKLYNTLTKQVDEFKPLNPGQITMYSCGPTVYDHIHIGNLRAFIAADSLRRAFDKTPVKHVMNFTDIDDKTIARSAQKYPEDSAEEALSKLTRNYEAIFLEDMEAIGNDTAAMTFVRATESIQQMQQLIIDLYKKKIAYIADDGVYFSIKAYQAEGKKYGQLLKLVAGNTSEARIDNDEYDKESVHDFALWKAQRGNEPAWDLELDGHNLLGRPGWHIECSAMSCANLGQPFDIHTGGIDLVFPHHENEIAQSTALQDNYANYFVHNEHLLVEGRKMSKSLNNFFTLQDVEERDFSPLAFRVLVLQAHYRNQLNFSWESLEAAQNRLQSFYDMAALQWQTHDASVEAPIFSELTEQLRELAQDDLDTPQMMAEISKVAKMMELNGLAKKDLVSFKDYLTTTDNLLGLNLAKQPDIDTSQKELLVARQKARDSKDWARTDEIRTELAQQSVTVRDTPTGQIWSRQI